MATIFITDCNITSIVSLNVSYPAPIFLRLKYENGILKLRDTSFSFSDLTTNLSYELDSTQNLNFNWSEYNTPSSITISDLNGNELTLAEGESGILNYSSLIDLQLYINRTIGVPLIIKNYLDEEVANFTFTNGNIVIGLDNNNQVSLSVGITESYTFTDFQDVMDYVSSILYIEQDESINKGSSTTIQTNDIITLKQVNSTDYLEIIFYTNNAEKNRVNKSGFITENFRIQGTLKESTSINNPSILIEYDLSTNRKILDSNYCYIPKFNRYYFIEEIISEFTNLFRVICKCDVLYSFKDNILEQAGIIARNEYTFNTDLVDEKMIQEIDYNIEVLEYTNSLFNVDDSTYKNRYVLITTEGTNI